MKIRKKGLPFYMNCWVEWGKHRDRGRVRKLQINFDYALLENNYIIILKGNRLCIT